MSVFKSIKGTLQSVQHGVSASFKKLSSVEKKIVVDDDKVNLNAGAEILNRFQEYWMDLHQKSEENAKRAEEVDSEISKLYLSCEGKADALNALNTELDYIPELIEHMERITTTIALINSQCEETERMLTELEDEIEEQDMLMNKRSHHYQLSSYTERKLADLNQFRVQMAEQHAQRVKELEAKKLAQLHERQEAFQQAFAQDIEHYKLYGTSPRHPSVSSNEIDIGEVKIDSDETALDDFLQSTEDTTDTNQTDNGVFDLEDDENTEPQVSVATDEDIDTTIVEKLQTEVKISTTEGASDSEVEKESNRSEGVMPELYNEDP